MCLSWGFINNTDLHVEQTIHLYHIAFSNKQCNHKHMVAITARGRRLWLGVFSVSMCRGVRPKQLCPSTFMIPNILAETRCCYQHSTPQFFLGKGERRKRGSINARTNRQESKCLKNNKNKRRGQRLKEKSKKGKRWEEEGSKDVCECACVCVCVCVSVCVYVCVCVCVCV